MALRVVLIALLTAAVQTAQPRLATLHGHVVRAGSSAPVAHARVVVAKVGGTLADYHTLTTAVDGRFTFTDVPPGTYRIYATHDGYLQGELGRRGPGGQGVPIAVGDGETTRDLEIPMMPTGTITGHVTRRGEAAAHVLVRALKARVSDGERSLASVDWSETDDRGEYRLFGLTPGFYLVSATAPERPRIDGDSIVVSTVATNANGNSRTRRTQITADTIRAAIFDPDVYPAVYYPGTFDATAAQPIEIGSGATAVGIDLTLAASPAFHLRGQAVVVDEGGAGRPVTVSLQSADFPGALPLTSTRIDQAGSFDFSSVAPGRYYVTAQTADSEAPHLQDSVRVDVVDHERAPVSIALRRGVTVTGRVTVDGSTPPPGGPPILVQLQGVGGRGSCCGARPVAADGTFAIDNVPARAYRLRVTYVANQGGQGSWIKSARFGGEDVTRSPIQIPTVIKGRELEIDLGTRSATLDAVVVDADRRPVVGVLVVARPADAAESGAYVLRTTGADGHARFPGLAPGAYTLFASDSIPPGDWADPFALQRVEGRGTAAELREAETKSITLRIVQ